MDLINLTVVTPQKKILTDEPVEEILVPGFFGELNILPGHAPLMTTLSTGILRFRRKGTDKVEYLAISWGYCHINATGVSVLAETAESADELEGQRVEKAKLNAEQKLAAADASPEEMMKYQLKLMRAQTRSEVVSKGKTPQ